MSEKLKPAHAGTSDEQTLAKPQSSVEHGKRRRLLGKAAAIAGSLMVAAGAIKGGEAVINSASHEAAPPTPREMAYGDTGFIAERGEKNANNPDMLARFNSSLPREQRPYSVITMKDGREIRV